MIRKCKNDGFFRGKACSICGEEGEFILSDREQERLSRTITTILRHMPDLYKISLDKHGWVSIKDIIFSLKENKESFYWLKDYHIIAIVETDPKGRFQINEDKIRATYGHSIDLDLDLPTDNIPNELYYPVSEEEVDFILSKGLSPKDRKKVHLSDTPEHAMLAGLVHTNEPIILIINAKQAINDGYVIMRAGKTVYLCNEVKPEYISKMDEESNKIFLEKAIKIRGKEYEDYQ
jgi:putative RNA 2'-phosphotransferase